MLRETLLERNGRRIKAMAGAILMAFAIGNQTADGPKQSYGEVRARTQADCGVCIRGCTAPRRC